MGTNLRMGGISRLGCAIAALGLFMAGAADGGTFDAWGNSMKVTFAGYDKPETLTNFPALVVLSTNITGFAYDQFQSPTGGDLRFAASNETDELNYEIEKWDTNGASYVWVQVDRIAGTNDFIYAYWGSTNTTPTPVTIWDTNYVGVWHMAATNTPDATTNARNGSAVGSVTPVSGGMVDGACDFDADVDYVQVPDNAAFTLGSKYTVSAWIKSDALVDYEGIVGTYNASGFIFALDNSANSLLGFWAAGTWRWSTYAMPDGVWKHVAYAANGTDGRFYVNGVQVGTASGVSVNDGGVLQIGAAGSSWPSYRFDGSVDEVRVSNATRGSNWLWACWANQASNQPLLSYGQAGPMATTLTVKALAPSALRSDGATANGQIVHAGNAENPEVYVCWAYADAGTNSGTSVWANVGFLGTNWGVGQSFSTNLTGLLSFSNYAYRCYVTNSTGFDWSDEAPTFTTIYLPAVTNLGAVNGAVQTWLRGEVTATGGETPTVWFSWWADGASATNTIGMGVQSGVFSNALSGLDPGVTYRYRIAASNDAGTVWTHIEDFQTLAGAWYVATNGAGSPGTSWGTAFTNLQDALNVASNGDVVYLAGHTFTVTNEIAWSNANVCVYGSYEGAGTPGNYSPAQWPTTIRQPAGFTPYNRLFRMQAVTNGVLRDVTLHGGRRYKDSGACLYIAGGTNITLSGVTLQNGYGYSDGGGTLYAAGLYASVVGNLSIFDCTIRSNSFYLNAATAPGAGLHAANCTMSVSNTVIWGNTISAPGTWQSAHAAGVYLSGGASVFRDCVVRDNLAASSGGASGYGGGLTVMSGTHRFFNCLVTRNLATAGTGDGVYVGGGTVNLDNCTIAHNPGQGIYRAGGTVTVSNSIVWANGDDVSNAVGLAYCDIEDGDSNGVAGCFSADPLFERGYYLASGSPCVNTGSVSSAAAGLDGSTTRADGATDAGVVDLGYHYAAGLPAAMADLYVSPEGTNTNSGLSWEQSLRTVTKALSLAQDGTRIHVATGLYNAAAGEVFPLTASYRSGLQILGTNAANTVLDAGAGSQRAMTLTYLSGDSRLEGLTLTRGRTPTAAVSYGGALYFANGSLTLAGCEITASRSYNTAGISYGGGIYLGNAFVTMSNCAVRGNWAQPAASHNSAYGGGLYASGDGAVRIYDSVFVTNYLATGTKYGAGLYLAMSMETNVLKNVLIARNTGATYGGGVHNASGNLSIQNATIADNPVEGIRQAAGSVTVINSILWRNDDDVRDVPAANLYYCDVEDGDNVGVNGCVSVDPLFVDTNHYHLAARAGFYTNGFFTGGTWVQAAADSPALDAGNPAAPYGREPQPNGRRANLGAYGNSAAASKTWIEEPGVFTSLTVHAYPASDVGPDYATLNGEVLHTGGAEDPHAYICWGPNDQYPAGTGAWAHVEDMGVRPAWESFSTNLTGLTGQLRYRCYVTNSTGEDWSSVEGFGTASPPAVTNHGAVSVRRRTASLTGEITDEGGTTPSCWFYYWPAGGVTSIVSCGSQTGAFTNEAGDLLADTLYTFRILASNSAGTVWSTDAAFQTFGANVGWYVATNGDATIGTNWPTAYRDIPAALAVAEAGDAIYVAGHTFERQTAIVWSNSAVTLVGSYEGVGLPGARSAVSWPTIVRPQATYSPRLLEMQRVQDVMIEGLVLHGGYRNSTYGANLMMNACTNVTLREVTLRNGSIVNDFSTWGAGAYVGGSTNISFESCTITNNSMTVNASDAKGAALFLTGSFVTFSNCLIRDNRIVPLGWLIPQGNGIYVTGGGVRFIRSIIAQNSSTAGSTADADGGGIYFASGTHSLANCLVVSNACAYEGDGLYVAGGTVSMELCTVANNQGYGVAQGGGTLTVTNSILWGNGDDVYGTVGLGYCDVEDGDSAGVNGCISADPLFADTTYYHLQSRKGNYTGGYFSGGVWGVSAADSPCINAGDPASPYDAEPLPNGRRVNMGAYGDTEVASLYLVRGTVFSVR